MKVILVNHNETYAIREMINAYFPKTSVEFTDEIPEFEDYILSEYENNEDKHSYFCRAKLGGKSISHELSSFSYDKNILKKTVFYALEKITGINLPWGILTGIRPSKIVREYKENGGRDAVKYLTDEYLASHQKATLADIVERNETKLISNMYKNGVSLYIGIPFCPSRCLYCSFTSQSLAFSNKLTVPYVAALKKEIEEVSKTEFIKNKTIETIYIGGGTPSALSCEQIDQILSHIYKHFDLGHLKEITFEAGRPDTIDEEKLLLLKNYNIDRICINPQTTNDKTLEIIGRKHSSDNFYDKYNLAKSLGFGHINCDIIAGLPNESTEDFSNTLKAIVELNPQSITVHTMSIKHGSYLDMNYDMYTLSAAKTVNKMLSDADVQITSEGKVPYYMYRQKNMLGNLENIGYAEKNHECIYNIYIMEEVQSIVALGAGGSTKLVNSNHIERVFNVKEVSEYIGRIDEMIDRKLKLFDSFE